MTAVTRPLAADFSTRLEALQAEAAEAGHTDLDYIIEMAVEIAWQRIEAQAVMPPPVDSDILRPAIRQEPPADS